MEDLLRKILAKLEDHDKRFDEHTSEISELRKEVGFYYASLVLKLDEAKTELSSELKQVTSVQKQHQVVLEYLNTKQ